MNEEQFNSEKSFLISLNFLGQMRQLGIVTQQEYAKIEKKLISKYNPLISSLIAKS